MKICSKCKKEKSFEEFGKDSSLKSGLRSHCKDCEKIRVKNYYKTKRGLVVNIYNNQIKSSKRRGHNPPSYSVDWLFDWVWSQEGAEELYRNWVESGFKKMLVPSVDRDNDYLPYTKDNLRRLCTWEENDRRARMDVINGVNNKKSFSVEKYSSDGEYICSYHSTEQASRETGIFATAIQRCCKVTKGMSTAGGYKWKYSHTDVVIQKGSLGIGFGDIPVEKRSKSGELIHLFKSLNEACGGNKNMRVGILSCSRGASKSYLGFVWKLVP